MNTFKQRVTNAFRIYNIPALILMKLRGGSVSFRPTGAIRGRLLLSYVILPFINKSEDILGSHTHVWECRETVKAFLEQGYAVDVIDWKNSTFIPKKRYDFFIDLHSNLERLAPYLNPDCVKIFHATIPHWLSQNFAEYERLIEIKKRRNFVLLPRRQEIPTHGIEYADIITFAGNKATERTYQYAKKQMVQISTSTTHMFPSPEGKDFEKTKTKFMWLGGAGMVRKGLDLTLEAFSHMPELELYVCGKVKGDPDFDIAYKHELYETKNIHTLGPVDLDGPEFAKVRSECVALIYPTATEGQAGSVIVSLHAGMIPIVNEDVGLDVGGFGIVLQKNTIEEIQNVARDIASRPAEELRKSAVAAWEYARENHTRERFALEYRKFVKSIIPLN